MPKVPKGTVAGKDWELFGDHLKYLTTYKENQQCRIVKMWVNAKTKDDPDGPKVIFKEIKISQKLFEKFEQMALEEQT